MLIQSLKQHFPARFPEWLMAGLLTTWGIYVVLHPSLFTAPATAALFAGMAEIVRWTGYEPAGVWGATAMLIGMVRAFALFVNGAYYRTPTIRLATSAMSAALVGFLVYGLTRSDAPNTGLVVYFWLFVCDVASAYRAASDIPVAEQHRIIAHGGVVASRNRGH